VFLTILDVWTRPRLAIADDDFEFTEKISGTLKTHERWLDYFQMVVFNLWQKNAVANPDKVKGVFILPAPPATYATWKRTPELSTFYARCRVLMQAIKAWDMVLYTDQPDLSDDLSEDEEDFGKELVEVMHQSEAVAVESEEQIPNADAFVGKVTVHMGGGKA